MLLKSGGMMGVGVLFGASPISYWASSQRQPGRLHPHVLPLLALHRGCSSASGRASDQPSLHPVSIYPSIHSRPAGAGAGAAAASSKQHCLLVDNNNINNNNNIPHYSQGSSCSALLYSSLHYKHRILSLCSLAHVQAD